MNRIIPYLEEIENIIDEYLIEHEITPYYNTGLEFNKEDSIQKLASFYAVTFMEKEHLKRLITLLYDKGHNIQKIGFNALIDVLKVLLVDSNNKKFIKACPDSHSDKSQKMA